MADKEQGAANGAADNQPAAQAAADQQVAVQAAGAEAELDPIDPTLVTTGTPAEGGCAWVAFGGDANEPTDATTKMSTAKGYVSCGDLSEDGYTATKSITNSEFKNWAGQNVLVKLSEEKHQYKLTLIEAARGSVAKLRYGSDAVEFGADGAISHIKAIAGTNAPVSLVLDEVEDTGYLRRTVLHRAVIDSFDDVSHKPGDLISYGFTFTLLKPKGEGKSYFDIYRAKPAQ